MQTARLVYKVKGSWPFPVDLLRFDESAPATSRDQNLINRLSRDRRPHDVSPSDVFEISLVKTGDRFWKPVDARWESRKWHVSVYPVEVPGSR